MVTMLVVLGSGGHTAEMLTLLDAVDLCRIEKMHFVIAKTDTHSHKKAIQWLSVRKQLFEFHFIVRAREVGQNWCSSIFSTVKSFIHSVSVLRDTKPAIILVNGPGTCLPVVMLGVISKCIMQNRIIYVESFARVKTLSLTGKIVYPLVDKFIVQWPELAKRKEEYIGKLY